MKTKCCKDKKSILKGKNLNLPQRITLNEHFTDLIQSGDVNPEGPAIIGHKGSTLFTPMKLDLGANQLAKAMRKFLGYWTNNNPDGDLVIAFCLHTTEQAILMIMAILKLGATYLSISTTYPEEQIVRIVGITRPLLIVTEADPVIAARFDCVKRVTEIVTFSHLMSCGDAYQGDPNDPVPLECLSPPWKRVACIVYTPGTTGEPHGVRITHTAIFNRIYWQFKVLPYLPDEVLCLSSLLVDAESIGEIFAPLFGGRPLYMMPRHVMSSPSLILDKIDELKLTRIVFTPSVFNALIDEMVELGLNETKAKVMWIKYWILSGDVVPYELGLKFFETLTSQDESEEPTYLISFYGATETTSEATMEMFEDQEDFKTKSHEIQTSIGLPLHNNTVYILDEDLNVVPEGTVGEIYITGISLASGYSDKRDNAFRFVNFPKGEKPKKAKRLFRTGDCGKIVDMGIGSRLYYEGRTDMVMKVRGREIELHDIVRAVNSTEMCTECAVLCYHRNREDQTAVAFCVMKSGRTTEELKERLSQMLEEIKMPEIYPVPTAKLPYLPSGKLDRQKLVKMYKYRRMESTPEDWKALGLGIAEKQAAKVLFEAISHTIGVTLRFVMENYKSSYWDIGGNSLNALLIVHACRENGYLISIDQFVLSESIEMMVCLMVESSLNPMTDARMLAQLCELAEWKYQIKLVEPEHKNQVLEMLSQCYSKKSTLSVLLNGITTEEHLSYIGSIWDDVIKEKLSLIVIERKTEKLVGAAFAVDANGRRHGLFKHVGKSIQYIVESSVACEAVVRQTTLNRDRGKVIRVCFLGTDKAVESRYNIILVEFMLKGLMQRALLKGFSYALIISASTLLRDLCGTILQYDVTAEIRLNRFVAKDKTKPFRLAGDYVYCRAYYKLFA